MMVHEDVELVRFDGSDALALLGGQFQLLDHVRIAEDFRPPEL